MVSSMQSESKNLIRGMRAILVTTQTIPSSCERGGYGFANVLSIRARGKFHDAAT